MSEDNSIKSMENLQQNPIVESDPYSKPDAREYYTQEKNVELPLYELT